MDIEETLKIYTKAKSILTEDRKFLLNIIRQCYIDNKHQETQKHTDTIRQAIITINNINDLIDKINGLH